MLLLLKHIGMFESLKYRFVSLFLILTIFAANVCSLTLDKIYISYLPVSVELEAFMFLTVSLQNRVSAVHSM